MDDMPERIRERIHFYLDEAMKERNHANQENLMYVFASQNGRIAAYKAVLIIIEEEERK